MLLELKRKDLIKLVRGSHVPHELMDEDIILNNGRYSSSTNQWEWNLIPFLTNTNEEIYALYLKLCEYERHLDELRELIGIK